MSDLLQPCVQAYESAMEHWLTSQPANSPPSELAQAMHEAARPAAIAGVFREQARILMRLTRDNPALDVRGVVRILLDASECHERPSVLRVK